MRLDAMMSIMKNEYIFIIQTIVLAMASLGALHLGAAALIAFVCVQCILANLFVVKQVALLGFNATAADAFTIGATLGLNLLQEYYGKKSTQKAIVVNFFLLIFYALVSQIHLWYTPSTHDTMDLHFQPLLTVMPRIVIASFTVFLISQMIDYWLYGVLRRVWQSRFLVLRNYSSLLISQLVDTVLFSLLGLYGLVENIGHIIIVSYTVKVCAIVLAVPFVAFAKKFYRPENHEII
jgi:uncharacterized integral membrane protein (TIGR00697 family)